MESIPKVLGCKRETGLNYCELMPSHVKISDKKGKHMAVEQPLCFLFSSKCRAAEQDSIWKK